MKRKPDPLLRTQPWRMIMVFGPIERILHGLETDGTVEVAGPHVVFKEDGRGGWYGAVAALRGVIEFHQLAQARYGLPVDVEALIKFANKLEAGSPIFEGDVAQARACIASCKRQAGPLRISQANDIVQTVQISMLLEKGAA
jgi:hypothetical protein